MSGQSLIVSMYLLGAMVNSFDNNLSKAFYLIKSISPHKLISNDQIFSNVMAI